MFCDRNNRQKNDQLVTNINKLSNLVNQSFTKLLSNFRLSISLRITLNYWRMLFKSAILIWLIFTVVLSGIIFFEAEEKEEKAARLLTEQIKEEKIVPENIRQSLQWSAIKIIDSRGIVYENNWPTVQELNNYRPGFPEAPLLYHIDSKKLYLHFKKIIVYQEKIWNIEYLYSLQLWQNVYLYCILGLIIVDIIRVTYFLFKSKKMNQRVLQPIEEIAETARRITAENLSQRINVHGTKNELKDLAVVINELLDRLEIAYNSQKQFVSDASHELRTPIAVIQGYANLLERWGKSDPEVTKEALAAISNEAANMQSLVENLLFLARHDKNTWNLNLENFFVQELVESIAKETELLTKEHKINIGPLEECLVTADKNAIKQALRIFADNSLKYTPAGGEITFSCRRENDWAALTVADTGQGIKKSELDLIFNRFYRSEQTRKNPGSRQGHGLGLSIARIIVAAHKGKIRVRSQLGQGSEFTILIKRKV